MDKSNNIDWITTNIAKAVYGARQYTIKGLDQTYDYRHLRVFIELRFGSRFHCETFDLLVTRSRNYFAKQAENELGIDSELIRGDLGQLTQKISEILEKNSFEPESGDFPILEEPDGLYKLCRALQLVHPSIGLEGHLLLLLACISNSDERLNFQVIAESPPSFSYETLERTIRSLFPNLAKGRICRNSLARASRLIIGNGSTVLYLPFIGIEDVENERIFTLQMQKEVVEASLFLEGMVGIDRGLKNYLPYFGSDDDGKKSFLSGQDSPLILGLASCLAVFCQRNRQHHQDGIHTYVRISDEDLELARILAVRNNLTETDDKTTRIKAIIERCYMESCTSLPFRQWNFNRKELATRWDGSDTGLRNILDKLVANGSLLVKSGKKGSRYVYSPCFDLYGDTEPASPQSEIRSSHNLFFVYFAKVRNCKTSFHGKY